MGLILDTSAVVEWERAAEAGREIMMDPATELAMPAIVWAEVLTGVRMAGSAKQASRRRGHLEALHRLMGICGQNFIVRISDQSAPPRADS